MQLSEASNLDLLERKISDTLARLAKSQKVQQSLKGEKQSLEDLVEELQARIVDLEASIEKMQRQMKTAKSDGRELGAIRAKLEGILSKFDLLDIGNNSG